MLACTLLCLSLHFKRNQSYCLSLRSERWHVLVKARFRAFSQDKILQITWVLYSSPGLLVVALRQRSRNVETDEIQHQPTRNGSKWASITYFMRKIIAQFKLVILFIGTVHSNWMFIALQRWPEWPGQDTETIITGKATLIVARKSGDGTQKWFEADLVPRSNRWLMTCHDIERICFWWIHQTRGVYLWQIVCRLLMHFTWFPGSPTEDEVGEHGEVLNAEEQHMLDHYRAIRKVVDEAL